MGFISELVDFVQLAKKAGVDENTVNDARAAHELFKKAKSISGQASKYRLEYPVAVTCDFDTAYLTIPQEVAVTVMETYRLHITPREAGKRIVIEVDEHFRVVQEFKTLHIAKEIIILLAIRGSNTQGVLLLQNLCADAQGDNAKQCY
jgi:glycyl-tRNA synthetase beta subunit